MGEGARFDSALLPARGWWRQYVTEALYLGVCVASLTTVWAFWLARPDRQLLLVAVAYSACGLWAGRSWLRRLLVRRRVLASGVPTLQMDDLGVRVRHPYGNLDGAFLAWTDCAAVVVSRMPTAGRTADAHRAYVEFVPVAPDRVEGRARPGDQRVTLLERPSEQVRTAWVEYTGVGRTARDVVAWLRARRPGLPVVDSLDPHSASTL